MKINKKLDKYLKAKIRWVRHWREFALQVVTHSNRKTWENLVSISEDLLSSNFNRMITDSIKYALEKTQHDT